MMFGTMTTTTNGGSRRSCRKWWYHFPQPPFHDTTQTRHKNEYYVILRSSYISHGAVWGVHGTYNSSFLLYEYRNFKDFQGYSRIFKTEITVRTLPLWTFLFFLICFEWTTMTGTTTTITTTTTTAATNRYGTSSNTLFFPSKPLYTCSLERERERVLHVRCEIFGYIPALVVSNKRPKPQQKLNYKSVATLSSPSPSRDVSYREVKCNNHCDIY